MTVALDLIIGMIVVYFVYDAIKSYVASTASTVWEKLLEVGKSSATILWQRWKVICAGLTGGLVMLADVLNAPGVGDKIQSVIQPQYVLAFVILDAIVSEIARRRTL